MSLARFSLRHPGVGLLRLTSSLTSYSCAGDWNRTNDLEGYEYTPLRALTICATPTKVAAFNVQLDNTGGWVRTNVL